MRRMELFFTMVLSISILSSCSHVAILDKEICADEGSLGAHCAHEYTNQTRDVPQPDWDYMRFGWFCMDPSDTTETKKEAEELCSLKGVTCDYAGQAAIQLMVHKHFIFTKRMVHHVERSRRMLYGLEAVHAGSIKGGPFLASDVIPNNPGMASWPSDAAAEDVR